MNGNDDFFTRQETLASIDVLADADPLVLFVGAGVPASLSIPTWWQLLEGLLRDAAERDASLPGREKRDEYVRALMDTYDASYLGSLVRQTYPNEHALCGAVREKLYRTRKNLFTADLGGSFVHAVWRLILTRQVKQRQTPVLTTNYDDTLEWTASKMPLSLAVSETAQITVESRTWAPRETDPPDVIPIYHLHGFVPRDEQDQTDYDIVLSAHDYGRDWSASWSSAVLERYWDCPWLFVGMSFTDSHVNFYLSRRDERVHGNAARPIGVFSLQGNDWRNVPAAIRPALVRAEKARLAELGMTPLPTDYFFQDAQLLREICLRVSQGAKKKLAYANRRHDWYKQFLSKRLPESRLAQTRAFLRALSLHLVEVREFVERLRPYDSVEMFKVELWARDIDERALFQAGSSEFVHHDPRRARRFPLTTRTRAAAAVSAFTRASPDTMAAPVGQEHGRWRSFFAAPISLGEPPWYDLPVGALVIASTLPTDPPETTLQAESAAGCAVLGCEGDVSGGERRPAWFEVDAGGVAIEVDRLDEAGADPAHRIEHQLARHAVGADDRARELGQHLPRMRGRVSEVAALPLRPGGLLCDRPDREQRRIVHGYRRTAGAHAAVLISACSGRTDATAPTSDLRKTSTSSWIRSPRASALRFVLSCQKEGAGRARCRGSRRGARSRAASREAPSRDRARP